MTFTSENKSGAWTMDIQTLDRSEYEDWDRFAHTCPGGHFFHLSGWQDVVEQSFGHKTYYLKAVSNGKIVGLLPLVHIKSALFSNGLISNAFCVSGGPLAETDDVKNRLVQQAQTLMKEVGANYLEFRDTEIALDGWQIRGDLYANFENEIAADEDENLKQIPRKQRAVVRKALKNEALSFEIEHSIKDFYPLYAQSVRNLGTPVLSRAYFKALLDVFKENCEVLTVSHNGQPVSSVLSFYFNGKVLPYYTGSTPDARRLGSNDLMYWQVMRQAASRKCRVFDFGRSKTGTGPYAFKKNWGFEPRPMPQAFFMAEGQDMPNLNPANPKYKAFISVWQKLPLPVANLIGPHIVSRIG